METGNFNSKTNGRGGWNNTKTILTASGLSAAVGVASGAAIYKFGLKKKNEEHKPQEDHHDDAVAANVAEQENGQPQQPEKPQQEQPTQHQEPVSNEDITTPQPTDVTNGNGGQQPTPQNGGTAQTNTTQTADPDDVDPDAIAQQIASANETDPNDLDAPDVITVDGMDIAMGPDGTEFEVAVVRTPDGGQFMLADIDGDGVFSDIFDMEGNFVGEVEGSLTASDLQEAADPTGGYMAYVGKEPIGEDPTDDIIATTTTGSVTSDPDPATNGLAENDVDPLPDVDDLLEQLLGDNDDSLAEIVDREDLLDSGTRNIDDISDDEEDYDSDDDDLNDDDSDDDSLDDEE